MKLLVRLVFYINIAILISGIYLQSIGHSNSELIIGIGVLLLAFVLMPLFIYVRYKGKDLTQYSFKNMQGPLEEEENK
tara:strand:- start:570 stop:803 length:234 start_codon:yes stop_codon:yes gene_type:complete